MQRGIRGQEYIYGDRLRAGDIYLEKAVADHLEQYPVPSHHVWFIEAGRQIVIDKPSRYFQRTALGLKKVNMYGIPAGLQRQIYDEVEHSGVAHIADPVGENMQFFPRALTGPRDMGNCWINWVFPWNR